MVGDCWTGRGEVALGGRGIKGIGLQAGDGDGVDSTELEDSVEICGEVSLGLQWGEGFMEIRKCLKLLGGIGFCLVNGRKFGSLVYFLFKQFNILIFAFHLLGIIFGTSFKIFIINL